MNIAIYSRKSVYTSTGDSIENQIDLCKDYYLRMTANADVNFIIYEDEGFSGKNTQRPQFQKLLADIKAKKINSLVCYRLDRISRNVADFSTTLELLQKYNVDFISIKEQFDTSTPMGRAMIHIASVFAQLERETIAERVRDNMIELSKTGRWLGGTPPLGFDAVRETYIDENLKEKSLSRFVENEEELKKVNLIFNKYLECKTLNEVSRFCIKNNISGKLGGELEKSGVSAILQNPAYVKSTPEVLDYLKSIGYSVFGVANGNGIMRYSQETNEKIAAVSIHKGIIDGSDWLKVQEILISNLSPRSNPSISNTAILTRLLKCGKCGANMIVKYTGTKTKKERPFYYVCANKSKSFGVNCTVKNLNGSLTEELVIDALCAYNKNELLHQLMDIAGKHKKHISDNRKDMEKNLQAVELKIKRLLQKLSLTDDIEISRLILSQIQEYKEEVSKLKKELNTELEEEVNDSIEHYELESILQKLDNFKYLFNGSTIDEKRKLLASVLEKVVWDEDTGDLNIVYKLSKKK